MIETAVLMCHAPIVVPAVAGPRAEQCRATTLAMQRAGRHLARSQPDVLVVLSPHAPRDRWRFSVNHAPAFELDFARFGVPSLSMTFRGAREAASALRQTAARLGLDTAELEVDRADHGAAVPLYFVQQAGFAGPVLLLALPHPGTSSEPAFGAALAATAAALGQRWSILASGDASHALVPGAPAGFHPSARSFDEAFVERLAQGDLRGACAIAPELRALAHEDAVASTQVAAAAVGYDTRGHQLLGYEGPFGVGYAEAILFDRGAPPSTLADVAREAVATMLEGLPYGPPDLDEPWSASRAAFVTLRDARGQLRGCVGRLEPGEATLAAEIVRMARSAAREDPRFPPVTREELATLHVEVSVLEPSEPVFGLAELDPSQYGVVVSQGARRGVLLPDIHGVDDAEHQVRIACDKARIDPAGPYRLERFRVRKVYGSPAGGRRHRAAGVDVGSARDAK